MRATGVPSDRSAWAFVTQPVGDAHDPASPKKTLTDSCAPPASRVTTAGPLAAWS
ncbi:MAG: hypothetical protein HS111_11515 [Kofleriaceae bacterium]|nr:hypothetical protein [Kofleriaceae bacterium]